MIVVCNYLSIGSNTGRHDLGEGVRTDSPGRQDISEACDRQANIKTDTHKQNDREALSSSKSQPWVKCLRRKTQGLSEYYLIENRSKNCLIWFMTFPERRIDKGVKGSRILHVR